jgi:hypothetical protein
MGIALNLIPTVIETVRLYRLTGSLLMLGRQDIETDLDGLRCLLDAEAFSSGLGPSQWRTENNRVTPESFFAALGFSSVQSLDVSTAEGAQVSFDLNATETPSHLMHRYDVIFDGGTLEHVFHIPNAFARCAEMLNECGTFVHIGPMNNYADHGFYQFSSTLWFDWFAANGWLMIESVLVRLPSFHRPEPSGWAFSFLPVGRLGSVGQLDDAPYMQFLVARKQPGATGNKMPMQAYYVKKYAAATRLEQTVRQFSPYVVTDGRRKAADGR